MDKNNIMLSNIHNSYRKKDEDDVAIIEVDIEPYNDIYNLSSESDSLAESPVHQNDAEVGLLNNGFELSNDRCPNKKACLVTFIVGTVYMSIVSLVILIFIIL